MRSRASKQVISIAVGLGLVIGAFFMVNVELPPWSHWLSGLNVILFALPAFWVTRCWLGWGRALELWAILGVYALLIETSAIYTGFPYGHFGYSDLLGAKLFGTTPWTVFLAWTPLVLGAYGIAANVTDRWWLRVALTSLITTAFDLVLDPGAVRLGFWKYADGGWWYGVPWSNFAGWLLTAGAAAAIIEAYLQVRKPLLPVPVRLADSALYILTFWTAIALWSGAFGVFGLGTGMLIAAVWCRNAARYEWDEMLVMVDETGEPTSTRPKSEVHTSTTELHLAYSIFLFNSSGQLLLQQRALGKKTWPGVWSNSCCGHQILNFPTEWAAQRRLDVELGISGVTLECILPDFRYRAEKDGVVENEICPVFVGFGDVEARPNPDEVHAIEWKDWQEFLREARSPESTISPWAVEEAELLAADPHFNRLYSTHCGRRA